jgi:UPF0042 nucleotide-binding protein
MLEIEIISFGFKAGPPPKAHMLFDVRFLKNPFWVDRLRPLTGLDNEVQDYVLEQHLAKEFLVNLVRMLKVILPEVAERKIEHYTIAFGCTGGQHSSTSIVEYLAKVLHNSFPNYTIKTYHRELDKRYSLAKFKEKIL